MSAEIHSHDGKVEAETSSAPPRITNTPAWQCLYKMSLLMPPMRSTCHPRPKPSLRNCAIHPSKPVSIAERGWPDWLPNPNPILSRLPNHIQKTALEIAVTVCSCNYWWAKPKPDYVPAAIRVESYKVILNVLSHRVIVWRFPGGHALAQAHVKPSSMR